MSLGWHKYRCVKVCVCCGVSVCGPEGRGCVCSGRVRAKLLQRMNIYEYLIPASTPPTPPQHKHKHTQSHPTLTPKHVSPHQRAGSKVIPSSLSRLPITSHSVATVSKATQRSGCQAPRAMHVIVTYLLNSIFIYLFILNASALAFTCAPSVQLKQTNTHTHL